ncbi:MAG: thioesterase family protein [Anaerolineae bacterium]|nr:thioesterase family protein [Anaerolineae bacterium]
MPVAEVVTRFRVRYAETDAMGIVHHSQHAIWFEAGRADFFRAAGISYAACEARGVFLPVSELYVRFSHSAFYDEEVAVHTRLTEIRSRGLTFQYEVRNAADVLLATGHTRHICVNQNREVQTIPIWLRQILSGGGNVP